MHKQLLGFILTLTHLSCLLPMKCIDITNVGDALIHENLIKKCTELPLYKRLIQLEKQKDKIKELCLFFQQEGILKAWGWKNDTYWGEEKNTVEEWNKQWAKQRINCIAALLAGFDPYNTPYELDEERLTFDIVHKAVENNDLDFIEFIATQLNIDIDPLQSSYRPMYYAETLPMVKLLHRCGAHMLHPKHVFFNSYTMHKDWKVVRYFIDYKVLWTMYTTPCHALCELIWMDILYKKESKYLTGTFNEFFANFYVLSKTSYCKRTEQEYAFNFFKKYHNHEIAKKSLQFLKHLYCCCPKEYREIFMHTKELPNVQDLLFSWAKNGQVTDIKIIYDTTIVSKEPSPHMKITTDLA